MLLHDVFDYFATARGHLPFASHDGRVVTYAHARQRANRLAHALLLAGLDAGDRFAYVGANSIDYALIYFAASKVGVVPVPLNARLTASEILSIAVDAEVKAVLADGDLCARVDSIRAELTAVGTWIALGSEAAPGWLPVERWIAGCSDADPMHRADPGDVLYQMYTSGTTGRPKGVLLTHRNVLTNCHQVSVGVGRGVNAGDRWLIVAPLFHAAAVITAFNCVIGGGCLVIHRGFDPSAVVRALADDQIALTTLVPAMIQACLTVPGVADRTYPTLQAIAYGGSAIAEPTLRRAIEVFGCDFYQGFGQTESSAGLTYLTEVDHRRALDGHPALLASCGRALPGTQISIVDEDGRPVPVGEVGEIIAHGPQLMRGYWNRPEDTARALRGGWLWTGDAGSLDADGYLTVRDRIRDMIVSGGENVYPREVENVLVSLPAVAEAAVIGVPDDRWGEAVHAVIVPAGDAALDVHDVLAQCRSRLADFKVPRGVTLVAELPRNAMGKVRKDELRAPHWSGRHRGVA
jgi:acyl-CoA synthetase (AMP-forming)/AMP-acid ligase II